MPEFSESESAFMKRAVQLARNGEFSAHPNPMVGCVLVKDGEIVGEGWHASAGEAHAEVNALEAAGKKAHGATAFVTLEPCAHHGKTPPCCDALIASGVSEVVMARQDPHPKVDGKGRRALEDAGIVVRDGLLQEVVDELLAGFLSRVGRGRPKVRLKVACSLDGCIAMADGQSQWITGVEARADVQRLRAGSGAVLTGIGTVLADDPSLTVRDALLNPLDRQPMRAVLDSRLRTPPTAKMLALPGDTLIFCTSDEDSTGLSNAGAEIVKLDRDGDGERLNLTAVLEELARREVNDLLVEAGPSLAGQLLEQGLVDEYVIYQAPHIMGSETLGMFTTPGWAKLADRQALRITDRTQLGNDMRITALAVG
jgi:diaminohydroxyphosphoribosylaminopyrimidine deaminase/5-amino-6-(5-phosphoribosylamino)uracil reductase